MCSIAQKGRYRSRCRGNQPFRLLPPPSHLSTHFLHILPTAAAEMIQRSAGSPLCRAARGGRAGSGHPYTTLPNAGRPAAWLDKDRMPDKDGREADIWDGGYKEEAEGAMLR